MQSDGLDVSRLKAAFTWCHTFALCGVILPGGRVESVLQLAFRHLLHLDGTVVNVPLGLHLLCLRLFLLLLGHESR